MEKNFNVDDIKKLYSAFISLCDYIEYDINCNNRPLWEIMCGADDRTSVSEFCNALARIRSIADIPDNPRPTAYKFHDYSENDLHIKINAFKLWAKLNYPEITEENDNGEWCCCHVYDKMISSVLNFIKNNSVKKATKQVIDDLLYAIARDNECSYIMTELEKYSEWFSLLCRQSLKTNYTNAKWQFAEHLSNYKGNDNLQELIYDFLVVEDEYTQRLALKSLAYIYPEQAEQYAITFWERKKFENGTFEDEYQKIMVLHVLYQIHSPKLNDYLELAEQSNYESLKINAQEIRKNIQKA
ncbi:MAG: hypothetical protein K2H93_09605 [Oscillospiraceae bacterium]|nr:hypothetical protein [Oscillospiraceae bacterium]